MNKKERVIIFICVLFLLIAILGVSYAAFTYIGLGSRVNTLTTGVLSMSYTESDNIISIDNALPTTDETGKKRLKSGEYFDFTIASNLMGSAVVNYEIAAEALGSSTLDGSNVKLYLTRIIGEDEVEVMAPSFYSEEESDNINTDRPKDMMSLATGTISNSEVLKYRLRMYVSDKYNPQSDDGGLTFNVKVNVYGKVYDPTKDKEEVLVDVLLNSYTNDASIVEYTTSSTLEQSRMFVFNHEATVQTESLTDYRYIGPSPDNYISFNSELWRILGVFTVENPFGVKEERVSIVRDEFLTPFLRWDSTATEDTSGKNRWSDSQLQKILNEGYDNETGGSLYYNRRSGQCYGSTKRDSVSMGLTDCDFTSQGLTDEAKSMIADAKWYLGGTGSYTSNTTGLPKNLYDYERGTTVANSTDYPRETSWIGKVGLLHLSDYGYATGGGSTANQSTCLNKEVSNWSATGFTDCPNNDWLFNSSYRQWTLSPRAGNLHSVFYIGTSGNIGSNNALYALAVRPVVYLRPDVLFNGGTGSKTDPFLIR